MTPMTRTYRELEKQGIRYHKVERWIPGTPHGKNQDLFFIIDLIALDHGIVGIQVCGKDWMPHHKKIMETEKENTLAWLENGGRLEVWGWRKLLKKRGGKAKYWSPRIADVLLSKGELYWEERK